MIKTTTNREIVTAAYKGLLNREPDQHGLDIYTYLLDKGDSVESLLEKFVVSEEFKNLHRPDNAISDNAVSDNAIFGNEIFDNAFYDNGITVENAQDWVGFGRGEIEYIKAWQDKTLEGTPGFLTDFVGVRTRIENLWEACAPFDGRVFALPIPMDYHADILEYVGTLRAVDAAKGSFSVMELGAGMGPWTVTSAVGARRRGIQDMFLCAIEGDAARYATMVQHLKDNRLENVPQDLLQMAVGVEDGEAFWPALDDPKNQAGARPLRDGDEQDASYLGGAFDLSRMIRVPVVAFRKLLAKRPLWDLIHIDVQGTEVELCAAEIALLNERARYIVIGTHSRKIDGELIELFHGAGWVLENDRPATLRYDNNAASVLHMTTMDGTQIWRNPRL